MPKKNLPAPLEEGALLLLEELRSLCAAHLPGLDGEEKAELLEHMVVEVAAKLIAEVRDLALHQRPHPLGALRAVAERAGAVADRIESTLQHKRTGLHLS